MSYLLRRHRRRILFLCVGGVCFAVQYALLIVLVRLGVWEPLANCAGFAFSAQLNFFLSSGLTWGDRPKGDLRDTAARLLAYNGTALVSLCGNTAVFALTYHVTGVTVAAMLGVVCGTVSTYLICDLVIFRNLRLREEVTR